MDSIEQSVKAWERQQKLKQSQQQQQQSNSKPDPSASASLNKLTVDGKSTLQDNALLYKEKGNEAFKNKDFTHAELFYDKSLEFSETVEALANRALVKLKLGKPHEAEKDCNRVLELDEKNVKALLRRGTARNLIGLPNLALDDFKKAESLEPHNKLIKEERERAEAVLAMYSSGVVATASTNNKGSIGAKGGSNASTVKPTTTKLKIEEVNDAELIIPSSTAHMGKNPPDPKLSAKAQLEESVKNYNRTITNLALKSVAVVLPETPPQTNYTFTKVWKDLDKDEKLKHKLLTEVMVAKEDYVRCFEKTLEPTLFVEISHALLLGEEEYSEKPAQVFEWLFCLPSFQFTKLFLSEEELSRIRSYLERFGQGGEIIRKYL